MNAHTEAIIELIEDIEREVPTGRAAKQVQEELRTFYWNACAGENGPDGEYYTLAQSDLFLAVLTAFFDGPGEEPKEAK